MTRNTRVVLFSTLFCFVLGCGSTTEPGGDAGTTPMVDAGTDAAVTPVVDAGTDAAAVPDDTSPTTTAMVSITDFFVGGNCKPIVPSDPITAGWTAHVSGATGSTATLTSATLHLAPSSGSAFSQTLMVDPASIALTGGSGMATQGKTSGSPDPTDACGALCNSAATLDLVFTIDGAQVPASATGTMGCAF